MDNKPRCNERGECIFKNHMNRCRALTEAIADKKCPFKKSKQQARSDLYNFPPDDKEIKKYIERLIDTCKGDY